MRRDIAVGVLPKAEKQEGNDGGEYEEFRFAGNFDFRLPAKELRGKKKSKYSPANQGTQRDKDVVVPNVRRSKNGTAQSLDKIGCWKEQGNFLDEIGRAHV